MTTLHYVITAQSPRGQIGTWYGLVDPGPDDDRYTIFMELVNKTVIPQIGDRINVLYFALEPNTLPAAIGATSSPHLQGEVK